MKKIIYISFLFISLIANGQVVTTISGIDTTVADGNGYDLRTTSETTLTVENSRFSQPTTGTYLLRCGDDEYNATTALKLNGAVIQGNYIQYTGTLGTASTHSVIAGYNLDYQFKYNYFKHGYYGIIAEAGYQNGDSMVNTNYNIFGNVFNNNTTPIAISGYDGVKVYNNTTYYGLDGSGWLINVVENSFGGLDENAVSANVKIKNNIFYSVNNDHFYNIHASCVEGFESDYNVFWCETSTNNLPRFNLGGTVYTWSQWQAMGYDVHSVVANPQFIDTINFIPSVYLRYGKDLGASYNRLLSTGGNWVAGHTPATTLQSGTWQVGARIHPSDTTIGDHWVSVLGDNSNNGSYLHPWKTIQYGFDNATGDTVIYRAGTYQPNDNSSPILTYNPSSSNGNNGTYNNWMVHMKHPEDSTYVTLDCKLNVVSGSSVGLYVRNTEYVKWSGFEIMNNWGRSTDNSCDDVNYDDNGTNIFDNFSVHDGGTVGFRVLSADSLYLINCDSYNRCDSLDGTSPGGDADGFLLSSGYVQGEGDFSYIEVSGCRAWNCSDDGIDLTTSKQFYVHDNWTFFNGILYDEAYRGDGSGIKTSGSHIQDITKRRIHNNLLTFNSGGGLSELNLYPYPPTTGTGGPFMQMYNNTLYKNYKGYNSSVSGGTWSYGSGNDSASVVSVNNLIYKYTATVLGYSEQLTSLTADDPPYDYTTTTTDSWDWVAPPNHWYNRYNPAFTITDDDFTSLDSATIYSQLSAPRNADGSLPDITVLKLTSDSDLIDGGTNIGLSYYGDAPDLGAFEWRPTTPVKKLYTISGVKQLYWIDGVPYYITVNE